MQAAEEPGLRLHHHLGVRRERAMFATLGFVVALAITRAVTTAPCTPQGPARAEGS